MCVCVYIHPTNVSALFVFANPFGASRSRSSSVISSAEAKDKVAETGWPKGPLDKPRWTKTRLQLRSGIHLIPRAILIPTSATPQIAHLILRAIRPVLPAADARPGVALDVAPRRLRPRHAARQGNAVAGGLATPLYRMGAEQDDSAGLRQRDVARHVDLYRIAQAAHGRADGSRQ